MKKNIFIAAIMLMALAANAQYEYAENYDYNYSWWRNDYELRKDLNFYSKKAKKKIATAKISGYSQTIKNKKNEYIYKTVKFDANGNCIAAVLKRKNGKIKREFSFSYSPKNRLVARTIFNGKGKELKKKTWAYTHDSLVSEWAFYRKGKEIQKKIYSYNKYGQVTAQEYIKKGHKKKSNTVSIYDSTRIVEYSFYKKGKPDFWRKWIYTRYADKSIKTCVVYKGNGKIKHIYNYECKSDGELQSKHKDTTMICKKVEYDADSNQTYTDRQYDEKGRPTKTVSVCTKDYKMLEYSRYHGLKDIPDYFYKYRKGTDEYELQIYYNNKGKESWKYANTFDENDNMTESNYYSNGKFNGKTLMKYNPQKFVTSEEYYNKKNVLKDTYKYEYSFY